MDDTPYSKNQNIIRIIADDFGLHEDINRGIIDAACKRIITGCSVAIQGEAATDFWLQELIKLKHTIPEFEIGIHVTLPKIVEVFTIKKDSSETRILQRVQSLIKHIAPLGRYAFTIRCIWDEQIKMLINKGITPAHLNSHQHIHLLPFYWHTARVLAHRYKIPHVRSAYQSVRTALFTGKLLLVAFQLIAKIRYHSMKNATKTLGVLCSTKFTVDAIAQEIFTFYKKNKSCEIMCHPGCGTTALHRAFPKWNATWDREIVELGYLDRIIKNVQKQKEDHALVMGHFTAASKATQQFIQIRSKLCPFWFVEAFVPTKGTILDFGCGHGYASVYCALLDSRRSIIAIDPSVKKREVAQSAFLQVSKDLKQCCVVHESVADIEKKCNAAMLLDVLYRIPFMQQKKILVDIVDKLDDAGVIIIKETVRSFSLLYLLAYVEECLVVSWQQRKVTLQFFYRSKNSWISLLKECGINNIHVYKVPGESINNRSFLYVGTKNS